MKHKISIALCTYNGAKYLPSQLESYLAQTRPPDEVIACDDRSQDETVPMLKEFAELAPFPIHILVNEQNIGSTKNFGKAISRCSGDIIFLSDQDDVWAPNKIERVVSEFDNDCEVGMVFSDSELVDESLRPLRGNLSDVLGVTREHNEVIKQGGAAFDIVRRYIVPGHALAFRAKYNKAIIPIPANIPGVIHDAWIAIVLSLIAKTVFLNEPLVKYRQHAEQQLGAKPRRQAQHMFRPARINIMEGIEEAHKIRKETVELIKGRITRMEAPERVINALNVEIDYRQECARHFQLRKSLLSDKHTMRVLPIIKELLSGRYHRCSNGIRSAAGDLVG